MYVALGFCTAGLIGLAILPAFYRRAARLTEEALRAVNPASYAEVRAAQDQERARHAVELRRVEKRLDAEREKAARAQIATTRLQAEVEALKKTHRDRLTELETRVAAQTSDQHAVDLLTAEVTSLKQKLTDAEKALAESWARLPEERPAAIPAKEAEEDSDWLPARDTMALATITGLEAEVATLKARLARYEPTVAGQLEADRSESATKTLAKLEAQLVDTEAKYVTAQAEVTRLSLMLDAAGSSESEQSKRLQAQLEKLAGENARHFTELKGKERDLERMTGQVEKLRKDLASVPALADLRREFRALAARLTNAEAITVKSSAPLPVSPKVSVGIKKTAEEPDSSGAKTTNGAGTKSEATSVSTGHVNGNGVHEDPGVSKTAESAAEAPSQAPSKSANIASAAEALVSRIVASNRSKARAEAEKEASAAASTVEDNESSATDADKTKAAKQKKKDVA
jgi:hypothetical protein